MLKIIKKIFQKKTVITMIFLSVIFVMPILSVNTVDASDFWNQDFVFHSDISADRFAYMRTDIENKNLKNYMVFWNTNMGWAELIEVKSDTVITFEVAHVAYSTSTYYYHITFSNMKNNYTATFENRSGNVVKRSENYRNGTHIAGATSARKGNIASWVVNTSNSFVYLPSSYYSGNIFVNGVEFSPYDNVNLDYFDVKTEYIFDLKDLWLNEHYKGLTFYFKKPPQGSLTFDIELIESEEDKPSFDFVSAFDLSFLNLADTLERIKQCEYNPDGFGGCFTGSGGTFGGGGGGGRFGDDDDYCNLSSFPLNIITPMTSEYGVFTILPCELHKQKTPDYFKTEQIKITTNAEIFLTHEELEEEIITNPPSWFDWGDHPDSNINSLSDIFKIINQYMTDNKQTINEISNVTNSIYSSLNPNISKFLTTIYSLLVLTSIAVIIRR